MLQKPFITPQTLLQPVLPFQGSNRLPAVEADSVSFSKVSKPAPLTFGALHSDDMVDLKALLLTIVSDPEEDTHRVALADWLGEHDCEKSGILLRKHEALKHAAPEEAALIQKEITALEGQARVEWSHLLEDQLTETQGSIENFYEGLPIITMTARALLEGLSLWDTTQGVKCFEQLPCVAL